MTKQTIKEYAVALFSLAATDGIEKEVYDGLNIVTQVFADTPQSIEFFDNPGVPKSKRLALINELFGDQVPEYVKSFLCVLCEKREMRHYLEIANEYNGLYLQASRISIANVRSAVELTENEKQKIIQKLEKKSGHKIFLNCSVDPSLIGGVAIDMDGIRYDGSIRTRLAHLKGAIDK
jgi:F-type H+-transporting ATPase subunit delta